MDLNILKYISENLHSSNFFNHFFKIVSIVSDNGYIWIALALILLIFKKTRTAGFLTLVGVGATFVLNSLILKNIFDRARPFVDHPEFVNFLKSINAELPDSSSFPSGHAFSSFCCATILFLCLKKYWAFLYIPASLVGFSRIFLCVHYPTDVLAGAIIGTLVAIAIYYLGNFTLTKLKAIILKKKTKIEESKEAPADPLPAEEQK